MRRERVVGQLGLLQAQHVGLHSSSHSSTRSSRAFRELTFQVASARRTDGATVRVAARARASSGGDYLCPWCYLGRDRTALLESLGVTVDARPYELHPEIPPEGRPVRPGGRLAAVFDHIGAECAAAGLPFARADPHANTRRALETAELVRAGRPDAFPAVDAAFYDTQWVHDRDLGDRAVVDAVLAAHDVDPTAVATRRQAGTGARALETAMDDARVHEVTGTPAWWVADRLLIPGVQDRDTLERWIRRLR